MEKGSKTGKSRREKERTIRFLFFGVALASITTLGLMALFLFVEGIPILKGVSVTDVVFGKFWYPTDDPADSPARNSYRGHPGYQSGRRRNSAYHVHGGGVLYTLIAEEVIHLVEGEISRHRKDIFKPDVA